MCFMFSMWFTLEQKKIPPSIRREDLFSKEYRFLVNCTR